MPFVVDASVGLSWHLEDEASAYADMVLDRLRTDQALAPALWAMEMANGLIVAMQRGRITEAGVVFAARRTLDLGVELRDALPGTALGPILELAQRQRLTVYDAAYLHLAIGEDLPLATQDEQLMAAASRVGVALYA